MWTDLLICDWLMNFASYSPDDRALAEVWTKSMTGSQRPDRLWRRHHRDQLARRRADHRELCGPVPAPQAEATRLALGQLRLPTSTPTRADRLSDQLYRAIAIGMKADRPLGTRLGQEVVTRCMAPFKSS